MTLKNGILSENGKVFQQNIRRPMKKPS